MVTYPRQAVVSYLTLHIIEASIVLLKACNRYYSVKKVQGGPHSYRSLVSVSFPNVCYQTSKGSLPLPLAEELNWWDLPCSVYSYPCVIVTLF